MPTAKIASDRQRMIDEIRDLACTATRGAGRELDPRALDAMIKVPRHVFVPEASTEEAYVNAALAIGHGQTISQPYIVALMTSLAAITPTDRVLEIGTGSGYQTAVLAALAGNVFSIEVVPALAEGAARVLAMLGITNIMLDIGDGRSGWPQHAPYDAIVVTAAPAELPAALVEQLAPGGRLVIPVGEKQQTLMLVEKSLSGEVNQKSVIAVRFVPLVA